MKKKIHINSLFFKTISTVIIGMIFLAVILSTINITMSKQVFVETFSESQEKIFNRIDWEFYTFYKDITNVVSRASVSTAIREYLLDSSQTDEEEISYILDMKRNLEDTSLADYSNLNVLFVGLNGKTYLHNSGDKLAVSVDEIIASDVMQSALENSSNLICEYLDKGFTDVMKQKPVIVFAKALKNMGNGEIAGVILITIKEKDINDMYSYFTSATSDILAFNQDNDVISTNNAAYFEGEEKERARNILAELQEGEITNGAAGLSEDGEYYLLVYQAADKTA